MYAPFVKVRSVYVACDTHTSQAASKMTFTNRNKVIYKKQKDFYYLYSSKVFFKEKGDALKIYILKGEKK